MSNTLISAYLGQGLLAARPGTPTIDTGCIAFYYATDTGLMYAYANGAWGSAGGGALFAPPRAALFPTVINGGSGSPAPSVTDTPAGMTFDSGPCGGSDVIRATVKAALSATSFTITQGHTLTAVAGSFRTAGIVISDGTKFELFGLQYNGGWQLVVYRFNSSTSFSASELALNPWPTGPIFLRIQAIGGNLLFSFSNDGKNFIQVYTEAIGAFLSTITTYGQGADAHASSGTDHIFEMVTYWVESSP